MSPWVFVKRFLRIDRAQFICRCSTVVSFPVPLRKSTQVRRRCRNCKTLWYYEWVGDHFNVRSNAFPVCVAQKGMATADAKREQMKNDFFGRLADGEKGAFSVDTNTPEAIEEFREKVKQGVCGITSQKDFLRNQRLLALYDREYSEDMLYDEFMQKITAGEIKEPDPFAWKIKKQFWYDRVPTALEIEQCGVKRPSKFRCATLLWLRSDQTMWYSQCFFYSFMEGPSNLEIAKLKIQNAIQTISFASERDQPEAKITDDEFLAEVEGLRMNVNGNYFETDDLVPVIAGMPL